MIRGLIAAAVLAAAGAASAEPAGEPGWRDAPFDDAHWTLQGRIVAPADIFDRKALRLLDGVATLKAADFTTGVIAYDVLVTPGPTYTGLRFHGEGSTYEYVYLRPDRSGDRDSNQYLPVFNGDQAWQIYTGPEFSSEEGYAPAGWTHVEARIYPDCADIYINGRRSLRIPELKTGRATGFIALSASQGGRNPLGQVYYSNVRYAPQPLSRPADMPAPNRLAAPGLVRHWQVAGAMSEADAIAAASRSAWTGLSWKDLAVEANGIANLSRATARSKARDTTVARFEVTADKAGPRRLRLGYSDRVHVFVNGQELFEGDATFLSRDQQFQGSVGFHDAVIAPLKRGRNDVAFVVWENYGGWAAAADFADPAGLTGLGG
jgi:hypothetical protein